MKIIAVTKNLPSSDNAALVELEASPPVPGPNDLLVRIEAVSVNPVDTKVRRLDTSVSERTPRVLGWDAAGVVEAVGAAVTLFRPGAAVYYAGSIARPGTNSEWHLVDQRIVGRKPATLNFVEAAALPLTALTAWESLFERLGIDRRDRRNAGQSLLILGGAGGVGSLAIQFAKLAGLRVLATASRPQTKEWVLSLGADHSLDHSRPLRPQLEALGLTEVDFIANYADTDRYWTAMAELIRPQGRIVSIVENEAPLDLNVLKAKSATFAWEFMFTRSLFETPDLIEQHRILEEVARWVEAGLVKTTLREALGPITAANLRRAHSLLEGGHSIGKVGLSGW